MKVLVEKLPLTEDTSFVARVHRTPNFEVPWHQHLELELILFTEGAGLSFIGNHVGEFETGDIYFLGSNLPHTFQKSGDLITSAVVIQFREDFWGTEFLSLPEFKTIRELFTTSLQGLKINGGSKDLLHSMIHLLEKERGFKRIIRLCECLQIMAERKDYTLLSTQEVKAQPSRNQERIDLIFQFTMDNFKRPIALNEVAQIAGLSIPAFCAYFKKSTKKKYVDFLNEVRIGYASKLLIDSRESIISICYESGYNTLAHFNKQFVKIKKVTPSKFRKLYLNAEISENVPDAIREIEAVRTHTY